MHATIRFWLRVLPVLAVGSLGMDMAFGQATGPIRINEVMARNNDINTYTNANQNGVATDYIELFNTNTVAVNLRNYTLTDSNAYKTRFVFNVDVFIPPRGFYLITCDSSRPASTNNAPFGLGASGGYVYLFSPGNTNPLSTPVDWVQYGFQVEDYAVGRVPDGTGVWTLCSPSLRSTNVSVALGAAGALKINEWMADPGNGNDWFEIYNRTNKPVAMAGLYLEDTSPSPGANYAIPPLSFIGTGYDKGFLKIVADNTSPADPYNADHVNFTLSKNGETIRLRAADYLTVIDSVTFGGQAKDVSEGRFLDGSANIVRFPKINDYDTFSPGQANTLILTNPIVSELLTHTDPPYEDAVEFQNRGTNDIDISGWWISNNRGEPMKARVPPGLPIPPGGFRVIYQYMFNTQSSNYPVSFNTNGILHSFTFNSAHGDEIHLYQTDTNGNLTGYRVSEVFESAANGVSFGHYDTSVAGDYKFIAMSQHTFGRDYPVSVTDFRAGTGLSNAYPQVGPVVINEIMYNPLTNVWTGSNWVENPMEEYIELRNITGSFVPLYYFDPSPIWPHPTFMTNSWRLQKAVDYTFPSNTWMNPYTFCLVVGFDPKTNYTALTNFVKKYNISTNSAATNYVPLYGPWTGRLANGGDSLELYRPDEPQQDPHPDAGYVPYLRVDKVNYLSFSEWPQDATGTGRSLQRLNPSRFGNDPINWVSDVPSSGRANPLGDNDGDGIPDVWESQYGLNPNDPSDGDLDPDGDGMTNYQEYLAGTDPRSAASLLQITQITHPTNTFLTLSFQAVSNKSYGVQQAGNLTGNINWNRVTNIAAAPSNRTIVIVTTNNIPSSTNTVSDRYFRIRTPQ